MQTTAATPAPDSAPTSAAGPCAAIDTLMAAKLRRQLEIDGSSVFVHAPRPAFVPEEAVSAWQRTYGADKYSAVCGLNLADIGAFSVLRHAKSDVAQVQFELGINGTIALRASPVELLEMARCLIDAAHDIEANQARSLAPASQGAA